PQMIPARCACWAMPATTTCRSPSQAPTRPSSPACSCCSTAGPGRTGRWPALSCRCRTAKLKPDENCSIQRPEGVMISAMTTADPDDVGDLLRRAANGDAAGWRALVERYHDRLRRSVGLRLDPRLRGRVDASDILQETYLDASRQMADYAREPTLPFF